MIKNNKLFLSLFLLIYSSYIFGAEQQQESNAESPLDAFMHTINMQRAIAHQQAAAVLATLQFQTKNPIEKIHKQNSIAQYNNNNNKIPAVLSSTPKEKPTKRKHYEDTDDCNNNSNITIVLFSILRNLEQTF